MSQENSDIKLYTELDCIIQAIPMQEASQIRDQFASQHPPNEAEEKIQFECGTHIEKAVHQQLLIVKDTLRQGELFVAIRQLQQGVEEVKLSLAYSLLEKERATLLLKPLVVAIDIYQQFIFSVDEMIRRICMKALPGVVLENEITQAVKKMKQSPLFQHAKNMTPLAVARFLHQYENIALIHHEIMKARALHCRAFLKEPADNFFTFRAELKKMTVYRVRRDVIQVIFNDFKNLSDENYQNQMRMLQSEYIRALTFEMEDLSFDDAKKLIKKLRSTDILQTALQTKWGKYKNPSLPKEIEALLRDLHRQINFTAKISTNLHDIDSPIELDVLGALTHQLSAAFCEQGAMDLSEQEAILTLMENSYHLLHAHDFKPMESLESLIVDKNKYPVVKKIFLEEKVLHERRKKILNLFESTVQFASKFAKRSVFAYLAEKIFFGMIKKSTQQLALELLLSMYVYTLQTEYQSKMIKTARDQYVVYHLLFKTTLDSPLFIYARSFSATQPYYHAVIELLQELMAKSVLLTSDLSAVSMNKK